MKKIKKVVKGHSSDKGNSSSASNGGLTDGKTFFHGTLVMEIKAAKKLPNMESVVARMVDKKDVTDPYVDVRLGKCWIAKTSIINNE